MFFILKIDLMVFVVFFGFAYAYAIIIKMVLCH